MWDKISHGSNAALVSNVIKLRKHKLTTHYRIIFQRTNYYCHEGSNENIIRSLPSRVKMGIAKTWTFFSSHKNLPKAEGTGALASGKPNLLSISEKRTKLASVEPLTQLTLANMYIHTCFIRDIRTLTNAHPTKSPVVVYCKYCQHAQDWLLVNFMHDTSPSSSCSPMCQTEVPVHVFNHVVGTKSKVEIFLVDTVDWHATLVLFSSWLGF